MGTVRSGLRQSVAMRRACFPGIGNAVEPSGYSVEILFVTLLAKREQLESHGQFGISEGWRER